VGGRREGDAAKGGGQGRSGIRRGRGRGLRQRKEGWVMSVGVCEEGERKGGERDDGAGSGGVRGVREPRGSGRGWTGGVGEGGGRAAREGKWTGRREKGGSGRAQKGGEK